MPKKCNIYSRYCFLAHCRSGLDFSEYKYINIKAVKYTVKENYLHNQQTNAQQGFLRFPCTNYPFTFNFFKVCLKPKRTD